MQRSKVAQERAGETGISIWKSERQVDVELFLDEYPQWGLGTPHQLVVLHEMFLHATKWGGRRQNVCSVEATGVACVNLILGRTNLPWN